MRRLPAWGPTIRDFGRYQHAADRSRGTIRLYAYRLTDLAVAFPDGPGTVTEENLIMILGNPAWMPETKKGVRTAYRSFFRWAYRTGRLPSNPTVELPSITVPQHIPRPAPEPVLQRSLRAAELREDFMIRLGAYAGLRCDEIARVHSQQWDRYSRMLTIVGKGGKVRRVAVRHPRLEEYLNDLQGYAFPNRWTGLPLTAGHVSKLLSRTLVETYTGHTLRHRYATRGLKGTGNIAAVSRALGHSRLDTTMGYTLLDDEDLIAVSEAAA